MLEKVISGGQTGADRAGLDAALEMGLKTGGWMPNGFKALDGYHPEFAELYGMQEHKSSQYPPRTALNAKESDATVRLATNFDSSGEKCTLKMVRQYDKPHFEVDLNEERLDVDGFADWLIVNSIKVLNVAGNSEKSSPGIYDRSKEFLVAVFARLIDKSKLCGHAGCNEPAEGLKSYCHHHRN